MENLEAKLKHLLQFGEKVSAFEFGGQEYFVAECGKLIFGQRSQKDFNLFDKDGKQVGHLYLGLLALSKPEQEFEKLDGVVEVPECFFFLNSIEISDVRLQGNGLGSFLLNYGLKDVEAICKDNGKDLPILFYRDNTHSSIPFYEKWGAQSNQQIEDNKIGSGCYMIMKSPKHQDKYNGTILGSCEKPDKKEDRHF